MLFFEFQIETCVQTKVVGVCEMSILPLVAIRICNTYVYVLTWIWTHSHQPIMPLRSHEAYIFYKTKKKKKKIIIDSNAFNGSPFTCLGPGLLWAP